MESYVGLWFPWGTGVASPTEEKRGKVKTLVSSVLALGVAGASLMSAAPAMASPDKEKHQVQLTATGITVPVVSLDPGESVTIKGAGKLVLEGSEISANGSAELQWRSGVNQGSLSVACLSNVSGSPTGCKTVVGKTTINVLNTSEGSVSVVSGFASDRDEQDEDQVDSDVTTRAGDSGGGGSHFTRVPSWYQYEPNYYKRVRRWGVWHVQHDYCTMAMDFFRGADLRGPCAYHDMCYQRYNWYRKSAKVYYRSRYCQRPFLRRLRGNCQSVRSNPRHYRDCMAKAKQMYWAVVTFVPSQP